MGKQWKQCHTLFFWAPKSLQMVTAGTLAIRSPVPLHFLNPACISGSSQFMYYWNLAWRIFEHYLAIIWSECNSEVLWTFFGIAFLWDCNENWPFPVLWPLLSFSKFCCHIECSTFTASSFRIWISSDEMPSPFLALFIVMLPKAHLNSHS